MSREPIQAGPEEGGRSHVKDTIPVPPAADDHDRSMEARIRLKFAAREPLTVEERAYIAHLPDQDVRYQ